MVEKVSHALNRTGLHRAQLRNVLTIASPCPPLSASQDRRQIVETLVNGLARLEYRGYDSAGIAIDGDEEQDVLIFKQVGKVAALRKHIAEAPVELNERFASHIGMAHTRWATHGQPSPINCHPHRSDPKNEFVVVHNGIITNYKELKLVLEKKGFQFETETDTESVAKLCKYLYDSAAPRKPEFIALIKSVIKELEGAFSFVFKSTHYPARSSSPVVAPRSSSVSRPRRSSRSTLSTSNFPPTLLPTGMLMVIVSRLQDERFHSSLCPCLPLTTPPLWSLYDTVTDPGLLAPPGMQGSKGTGGLQVPNGNPS